MPVPEVGGVILGATCGPPPNLARAEPEPEVGHVILRITGSLLICVYAPTVGVNQ